MMAVRRVMAVTAALLAAAAVAVCQAAPASPALARGSILRVDQVGYLPQAPKRGLLMTAGDARGLGFSVTSPAGATVLTGRIGSASRAWGRRWRHVYPLDFNALRAPSVYVLRVGALRSAPFRVDTGAALFAPLAGNAVAFLARQRDGAALDGRPPPHRNDRHALVYRTPRLDDRPVRALRATRTRVDVAGGWADAGDYLKFTSTASFTDTLLLFTLRDLAPGVPDREALEREARWGTDWLLRMWQPRRGVLLEQVGIGDGDGDGLLGDHDLWRLPQRDDAMRGRAARFIAHRPVFAANLPGRPISPNLAGRTAAAFALCAQVFVHSDPAYAHRCLLAGQQVYQHAAKDWRGPLAGSVPTSYYGEPEWRDDMELAAIELYLATRSVRTRDLPHRERYDYLEPAATWADAYMSAPDAGQDSLNLYDVSALAHSDLYRVMVATHNTTNLETNASDVLADLRDQLRLGAHLASREPFGLANPATNVDTVPHALGYAVEARLYDDLVRRPVFAPLAQHELDWVLGANPWGTSFVVGAGSAFPRCLSHQVANLAGSPDGRGALLLGATVDGPTSARDLGPIGAPDGFRRCPARGGNAYRRFDADGLHYLDDVRSPSTSEPADDITALALVAFAQSATPAATPRYRSGTRG